MTQTGKGLIAFALIFGLIGTGLGGFMLVNHYALVDDQNALINDQNTLINDLNELINNLNELINDLNETTDRVEDLEEEEALEESYVVPRARVYRLGSYSLSSGSDTLFDYTNTSYDTHNAFNLISDSYVIPETGYYQVIAQYCITAVDQDFFQIEIMINGSLYASRTYTASHSTNTFAVSITDIVNTTVGDLITINAYSFNSIDASRSVFSYEEYSFFTISKLF